MFLGIKNYFLVVLGENDGNKINVMIKRMQNKGKCVRVMDRTYVLVVESNDVVKTSEIRQDISGQGSWMLMVIRLNSDTNAAWCLKTPDSEFFKTLFNEINN